MERLEAHQLIDTLFDTWANTAKNTVSGPITQDAPAIEGRKLPEGKRVVRTKQSGDRVYLLDEEKKTRAWITNPEVLKGLGFEIGDVVEVDDSEMLKYQMSAAVYRIETESKSEAKT